MHGSGLSLLFVRGIFSISCECEFSGNMHEGLTEHDEQMIQDLQRELSELGDAGSGIADESAVGAIESKIAQAAPCSL